MNNLLITGAAGLLGGNLCYLFKQKGFHVTGAIHERKINIPYVNLIHINKLGTITPKIDYVIHCAAKTNVDECETNPADAYKVNVELTENIIDFSNDNNALLIHISTDAVYKNEPEKKSEEAPLEPLSIYAKTKFQAEKKIQEKAKNYYIIRTNLFGFNILNKNSLAEWVLYSLRDNQKINGFYDVFFSPVLVNDLFAALLHVIGNQDLSHNEIMNIGSSNSISKYDFACAIAEDFDLNRDMITKISVHDFGFVAPRSENSVMDSSKFESIFQFKLPSVSESLKNFHRLYEGGYHDTLKSFNII